MKTNIINIHGMYVVRTGKTLVYENNNAVPEFDEDGNFCIPDEYTFSDEIVDIFTGIHYGFDGIIHLIGKPVDSYVSVVDKQRVKRGRHSRSNNKQAQRHARSMKQLNDDLPF